MSRRILSARERVELLMAWRRTATDDVQEPEDGIKPSPGPHRLSIERHLLDEDYREDWMGSDESYVSDPEMVHENHASGAEAVNRMRDVAADWACTVSEYPGDSRADGGEPGTRYFQFDGPEEGEIQGYAELRPRPVPKQDYRPGDDAYPALNRSLLSRRTAAMRELDWDTFTEAIGNDPDEQPTAITEAGDTYYVMPPWKHHEQPVNGFGDVVKSEHPEMWALIHRYDPDNGFWDHAVTYHPTMDHAKGAAEHHHVTGEAPGRWPGTVPHSDYDPDDVEYWPERAQNTEDEREDDGDDGDDRDPLPPVPDMSLKDREDGGLRWQKHLDGRELFYHGDATGTSQHQYEVVQERGDNPSNAQHRGKFRVLWHKPGYNGSTSRNAAPDGSFQEEHGGLGWHPSLEDAMAWAEQHNRKHSWNPETDPFDPRTFGASRDDDQ